MKGGTLLPLAEPVEYIKPDTCFNITVNIVGDNPIDFTLCEDDGFTVNGAQNQILLHSNGQEVRRPGDYGGSARFKIINWKQF